MAELAQILAKFFIKLKSRQKLLLSEILIVLSLQSQQCYKGQKVTCSVTLPSNLSTIVDLCFKTGKSKV